VPNNNFEKRMAARALFLMKGDRQNPQTQQVAKSARLILAGTGTPQDVAVVRQFTGDFKSGSSGAKRFARQVNQSIGRFTQAGNAVSMAQIAAERGQGNFAADLNLFQVGQKNTLDFVKSKQIRQIVEGIGNFLGSDSAAGTRFFKSVTRGLRFGGAVGQVLGVGIGLAEEITQSQGSLAKSVSRIKDAGRDFGNIIAGRAIEKRSSSNVRGQSFFNSRKGILSMVPNTLQEYLESRIADEVESTHKQALDARNVALLNFEEMGNRGAAMSAFAREHGLSTGIMTAGEQRQALLQKVDEEAHKIRISELADKHVATEMSKLAGLETEKLRASGGIGSKMNALREEYVNAQLRSRAKRSDDRHKQAEFNQSRLTPKQRYDQEEADRQTRANYRAYVSRHAVVEID